MACLLLSGCLLFIVHGRRGFVVPPASGYPSRGLLHHLLHHLPKHHRLSPASFRPQRHQNLPQTRDMATVLKKEVGPIGYGLASLTTGPSTPHEDQAIECLRTAADLGYLV